jgi:hypothetical protein
VSVSVATVVLLVLVIYAIVSMFLPPETTEYSRYKRLALVSLLPCFTCGFSYFLIRSHCVVKLPGHNRPEVIGYVYSEEARKYINAIQQEEKRTPDVLEVLNHHENSVEATFYPRSTQWNAIILFLEWLLAVESFSQFWIVFINYRMRRALYKKRHSGVENPTEIKAKTTPPV